MGGGRQGWGILSGGGGGTSGSGGTLGGSLAFRLSARHKQVFLFSLVFLVLLLFWLANLQSGSSLRGSSSLIRVISWNEMGK
jgi:hypothetical protein